MRYYLIVLALLCGSVGTSLSAQLEGKVELLADNQTYLVSVLPDFTLYPGASTTNNAQITVKVPTGGFVFDGITSITGTWNLQNSVIAPVEEPGFDYYSFNATGIVGIVYEAGVENQLFTFRNSGDCTGTLDIIDNATDPFMPPNSANVNVGNLITVLGLGPGNQYAGNFAGGAECPELLSLTATALDALVTCHGDSTSIEVSVQGGVAPYALQWTETATGASGSTTITAQNGSVSPAGFFAGDWQFVVNDSDNNSASTSRNVSEPAPITAASVVIQDADCDVSQDGSIALSIDGGTAPYTYAWSDGQTVNPAVDLNPGDFTVTVTDANGCTLETAPLTVGAINSLTVGGFSTTNASCDAAANGTATVTAENGSGPYTYLWSNGSTDQTATGLPPGDYSVTITDANGCTLDFNLPITISAAGSMSVALIGSDAPNCAGSADGALQVEATAGQAPYTYLWSSGHADSLATGLDEGTYSVTVTDAAGCTAVLQDLELISDGFLTVSAVAQAPFCFGDTDAMITLTTDGSAGPFTYQWAHSATADGPLLDDITSGTYFYTVTDATGVCNVSDSVVVSVPQRMVIETASTAPTCYGDEDGSLRVTAVQHATAPFLYSLDGINFGTEAEFGPLVGGFYTVHVEDVNGCRDAQEVLVNEPAEVQIELGDDITVDLGDSLTLYPAIGGMPTFYQWVSSDSLDCTDCPNPTWTPLNASLVTVTVRDSFGCTATDAVRIFVNRPESVFIPNAFSPDGDGRNDELNIYYGGDVAAVRDLVIFDRWGDRTFERTGLIPSADPNGNWRGWFRGKPAPAGVYVYRVTVEYVDGNTEVLQGDVTLMR